jgi:2-methylisocitrate lyase-like PEP mutase family enzyme
MDTDYRARRDTFRRLHESGCFVIPNPWDAGSAKYLQSLGFPALASTSAGLAFARGLPDAAWAVPCDAVLANLTEIVGATPLPVNADFESGYSNDLDDLANNIRRCIETGVAGLSIEDATGDPAKPLFERSVAIERFRAARKAVDATKTGVLLTARSECFLTGHPEPLREAIDRLTAFAAEGADVLYAPGVSKPDDIRTLVRAVAPKPVNFLMSRNLGLRVDDIAEMGVRRVSVGSSLARAAWTGFLNAAREIARQGSFGGFDSMVPFAEINGFFGTHYRATK